ncbi:hypothetical protein NEOLEDRAFT_1183768 [Neolentinus lepideus HHB14362 ss-1]|uniref:DUF4219 domain-containing protein n=1 Tax=Neolentinus lepideus HHB14362 ss-1 TaxID=1314782 RepID=A0A165N0C4_9AGAM|nr:hypothetical protein NEOLEDRAFT_1183768 [Neolentinus lepideus HHB14362 ss-1]
MTKFLNACGATYVYATIKPTLAEKDKELDGQVAWLIYGKVSAEWQYLIEDAETAWDTWKALKESLLGPFQPSTRSPASSLGQNLLIWSQTGLYCSILSSYAIITVVAATSPSIVAITMSTTTPTTKHPFLALGEHNYRSWADDMEAYLKTLDLWDVTNDPTAALLPIDAANPTTEERKKVQDWEKHKGQASGQIWLAVEDGQKVHVKEVKSDPAKMWLKLKELAGESLASLMAQADKAMQDICALHPKDFTIDSLNNDFTSMALICALPAEYNNFMSSLLLLDSLDLSKLQSVFQNEESQRFTCSIDTSPSLAMAAGFTSTSSQGIRCTFCDWEGHTEASCEFNESAAKTQKAKTADHHQEHRGGKKKAQNVQEASEDVEASANIAEYAGKASVALSALDRSSWLSSLAAANWNTDTGAPSHMMPH